MPDKILIGAAWPYAAGSRHLGHVTGFGLPGDAFARYHRLKGNDVLMVSGTDEHGTPITVRATREGRTAQEVVDHYNREIADNLRTLGCSFDLFTRTTTANHYAVTQQFFTRLHRNGHIFKQTTDGTFCEHCTRFLPDRYVEGTCPHCNYEGARGDQCEACGRLLDPTSLVGPSCKICGRRPVVRETEQFFLDLTGFADRLRRWVVTQDHWRPNARNFTLGLLEEGLRPRAITRDIAWGVPIPVAVGSYPDKRIYVWMDAVIGYLSASMEHSRFIAARPDKWREWWQNPDARHYYFMGKDNIVFHSIIWPSMLIGYGKEETDAEHLQLPYNVVASEFLTMEGRKFSSSRGVAVWLPDFLRRYDPDALRYLLTINGPETGDTDFTWAEFLRRNNDELVATWGNLVHRVLSFTYEHFGKVPDPGDLDTSDQTILAEAEATFAVVGGFLEQCRFKAALTEAMKLAQHTNRYLDRKAPWLAIKTDRGAAATSLCTALRVIDSLKILLCPFLPHSSQLLHEYLGNEGHIAGPLDFREIVEENGASHHVLTCQPGTWVGRWQPSRLPAGQRLHKPKPLFKKLDDGIVDEELRRMRQQAG
jgi:methionyl-tRNA synthetase